MLPVSSEFYPSLQEYIQALSQEFAFIPADRQPKLAQLTAYMQQRVAIGEPAKLTFICTHNSRRSHLAQLWAQTAAYYYQIPGVEAYSGGTEVTAFNPRAVAALRRSGFEIEELVPGMDLPGYTVRLGAGVEPIRAFSKLYDAAGNPTHDFCAVLTCSDADAGCPFIPGANARVYLPYDDPKAFDDTEQEAAQYDERTRQIARELFYAFSRVKGAGNE